MQSSRSRLTCRARNRFTPSIALWQHFIAPGPQQQRLYAAFSTTTTTTTAAADEATREEAAGDVANVVLHANAEATPATPSAKGEPRPRRGLVIRRPKTDKPTSQGAWQEYKRVASVIKNAKAEWQRREASRQRSFEALTLAKNASKALEDYEGIIVEPMVNPEPVKESSLPWCPSRAEREDMSAMDRLALEMERFCAYAKPTRLEQRARDHVIKEVRRHVLERMPDHTLEVFGSERTGLALATSDIDFRLIRPHQIPDPERAHLPPRPMQRSKALGGLQKLHSMLKDTSGTYLITIFRYARYPLISLQHRTSTLDIQIVLANDTTQSRDIIQRYLKEYPYLLTLFTVIKTIFEIRGLSDVFRGGFGSYSLFMMIVASIQHQPHARNDAAGALVNFLRFWRDFDTTKHGVSIEPAEIFDKQAVPVRTGKVQARLEGGEVNPLPIYMLCLRDPADPTNDLGRKGAAIKHVQATFRSLLQRLVHDIQMKTRPTLLGPLVGPVYMLNLRRREQLEALGKRLELEKMKELAAVAKAIREGRDVGDRKGVEGAVEVKEGRGTKEAGSQEAGSPEPTTQQPTSSEITTQQPTTHQDSPPNPQEVEEQQGGETAIQKDKDTPYPS
ncbi:hypothetical protein IAQ61_006505 [Plenodomus lingam]|uniref:Poly(A) RNA polymerase mitochondrial-like central palm domain-containing protein n=1 Tax=Leptosphaeria maculans (strain JN3 / isolate v23.1.3 / race Av1-4-5-6-7-8) TaxID=985895 RepID=E5AFC2_LEPMJ|nr:hypothetical protein LEMA_P006980.1 [Plenodomus lingam JN3]KAH9869299.1 hypothetical protein IAQ61_006505 [Plenodomus lingam]CBY01911.1 hypothetical protein LEMA_P006980.1 [Plenodomus lingam JN3]